MTGANWFAPFLIIRGQLNTTPAQSITSAASAASLPPPSPRLEPLDRARGGESRQMDDVVDAALG
jgi:hypothetical protein